VGIVNAAWYTPNKLLHADLKIPTGREEITKFSIRYRDSEVFPCFFLSCKANARV
jgi:hypothetical protein